MNFVWQIYCLNYINGQRVYIHIVIPHFHISQCPCWFRFVTDETNVQETNTMLEDKWTGLNPESPRLLAWHACRLVTRKDRHPWVQMREWTNWIAKRHHGDTHILMAAGRRKDKRRRRRTLGIPLVVYLFIYIIYISMRAWSTHR